MEPYPKGARKIMEEKTTSMSFQIDDNEEISLAKTNQLEKANSMQDNSLVIINHEKSKVFTAEGIKSSKGKEDAGGNYLSTIGPDKIKNYDELCKILSLPNIPRFRSIVNGQQKPRLFNDMQVGIYECTQNFSYENNASTLTETADWSNKDYFETLYRFANQYVGIKLTEPKNQFVLFVEDKSKEGVITFLGVFYVDGLESLRLNKIVLRRVNGNNTQELSLKDLR